MNRKGTLFVVTGPSGAGKGTVLKEVTSRMDHLYFSVSATTRAPRAGEADGVHYHFLDRAGFEDLIRRDRLLEYAEYVGNYYGTPLDPVTEHLSAGDDVLLEIEVQGALKVKEKRPDAALIFIAPPSWEELERRLTGRGTNTPEDIQSRLLRAKVEFQTADTYDYFVINDSVENAVRELDAIITAEHCKPADRMEIIRGK